jgi:hypothetical protein
VPPIHTFKSRLLCASEIRLSILLLSLPFVFGFDSGRSSVLFCVYNLCCRRVIDATARGAYSRLIVFVCITCLLIAIEIFILHSWGPFGERLELGKVRVLLKLLVIWSEFLVSSKYK